MPATFVPITALIVVPPTPVPELVIVPVLLTLPVASKMPPAVGLLLFRMRFPEPPTPLETVSTVVPALLFKVVATLLTVRAVVARVRAEVELFSLTAVTLLPVPTRPMPPLIVVTPVPMPMLVTVPALLIIPVLKVMVPVVALLLMTKLFVPVTPPLKVVEIAVPMLPTVSRPVVPPSVIGLAMVRPVVPTSMVAKFVPEASPRVTPPVVPKPSVALEVTKPPLITKPPVKPLAPFRFKLPMPVLVRDKPAPPMAPPTVRLPLLTATERAAPSVTVPEPRFKSLVPVKAKSLFQAWGLLAVSVMAAPEVLSMVLVLVWMVKVPATVPRAVALLMFNVPWVRLTPPVKVPAPPSVTVPAVVLFTATEPARGALTTPDCKS